MASAIRCLIPRLNPQNTVTLICDMQEAFRGNIHRYPEVISIAKRVIEASNILGIKMIASEQYPKGLGHTVSELEISKYNVPVFDKKKFSMCSPQFDKELGKPSSVLICGVEAHVCVMNSTLDLLDKGIGVFVVADAVSSRSNTDRLFALKQMQQAGAVLTTSESVLLTLLGGSDHQKFKQVQKLIMISAPDTDLFPMFHA